MKLSEFIKANVKYFIETELGSFIDTVASRQPIISYDETNSDLHTHPYISSVNDLYDTLDVLVKNNVDICAITTHGKGDSREFDFWKVKKLIEKANLISKLDYDDKKTAFKITHKDKRLTFVGAYEMYVLLKGVKGRIDIVSLMPEKGFEKIAESGLEFEDYMKMNRDYGAIVIGAHPYTIWDPYGPKGFFKFKLATEDDRKRILDNLFSYVDSVDLVSTNCAWMVRSDELLQQDYQGKPLANSDAHSTNHYTRNEIGRSGNIFRLENHITGDTLREQLRYRIISNSFRTYFNHSPSLQFLQAIVLNKPPKDFP